MVELLSVMSESCWYADVAVIRSGISTHTECLMYTGTSDARQESSTYATPQATPGMTVVLLSTHLLTVIRRQESSTYATPQATPSMLWCISPLSEVKDCYATNVVKCSSDRATTTNTIHQSSPEIHTQWGNCCPDTTVIDRPKTHDYIRFHRYKTHWEVFPALQPSKWLRWLSTNHPLPS